ncbi:MAG: hypothetical protein V1777_04020 [Candidatus Micrarchaeota archaeon]
MSVFENIVGFILIITLVVAAYFILTFNQANQFEQQAKASQTVFYSHQLSENLVGILKTTEPVSNMPLSELIGHYIYYKNPSMTTGFVQVNVKKTVENAFDAVYGKENYFFQVEPKGTDVRMIFLVDGSKSLKDDLESLHTTLPPLMESFEGTGIEIEPPQIFILKSNESTDPVAFDCQSFDWTVMVNGEAIHINCLELEMQNVYADYKFESVRNLPIKSYEDWASATAFKAIEMDNSPLEKAITFFFPISDELSTGSEPDSCNKPDYSYCEKLYSSACCNSPIYQILPPGETETMPYCSSIKPECQSYSTSPELCGNYSMYTSNPNYTKVMDCYLCEKLGKTSYCTRCKNYKNYCEVCGQKTGPPNPDYSCGSQRSAQTVENAARIIKDLERPDFYIFPIQTDPCYPSTSNPSLEVCSDPNSPEWGYQCWNYSYCSPLSGTHAPCCEQSTNCGSSFNGACCSACQANPGKTEACVRNSCDEAFTIDSNSYAQDGINDLQQQMELLAKSSANSSGKMVNLTGNFDVNTFQQELRNLVINVVKIDFRIGSIKQNEERFVTETLLPLSNGRLTTARLWLYKNRSPHTIEKAESEIEKLNFAPEAKLLVYPMPYCSTMSAGSPATCTVIADGRDSTDPNSSDPVFGEQLYYEWDIVPRDATTPDYADDSGHKADTNFSIDLPDTSGTEQKTYYTITLTVTDEEGENSSAILDDYCVGEKCIPTLQYNFIPFEWDATYQDYLDAANAECQQIKASMPCQADKILCATLSADQFDPALPESLSGIKAKAVATIANPSISWTNQQRNVGISTQSLMGGVGYTYMYGDTEATQIFLPLNPSTTYYPFISVHELGHTYGLCEDYSEAAWISENNDTPGGCVNQWHDLDCVPNSEFYGDTCQPGMEIPGSCTCASAMSGAFHLPHSYTGGSIQSKKYDSKNHTQPSAMGATEPEHIRNFTGC